MDDTEIIERWLYGRPRTTQKSYLADVEQALQWIEGTGITEITLMDLQDYQEFLFYERALKPATVCRKMSALSSLLEFAAKHRLISYNPCRDLRRPDLPDELHERILTVDQVSAILAAPATARDRAILRFTYATGARVSEVISIRWKDLIERNSGVVARFLGKGHKQRFVKVPASIWAELQGIAENAEPDDRVFPISRRMAHEIMKAAVAKTSSPQSASFHWLRHSHASHSLQAGANIKIVKETLGHKSIETTDRYLHASPEQSSSDYLGL